MPIFINYNKIYLVLNINYYICRNVRLGNLFGCLDLVTLASFTVDSFTIWQMVKKEVNMEVMFILGAVGFMQELQVSDKIWESI